MPRFFTREEAERLLPEIEPLLREALLAKHDTEEADGILRDASRRIAMMGGSTIDRERLGRERHRREASVERLQSTVQAIQQVGVLIKDLDIGLVDFPTLYRGNEVYLCWKLGEGKIQYWHAIEAGFPGRKPIDEEFLAHHRGGEPS